TALRSFPPRRSSDLTSTPSARAAFVNEALRPAATTERWRALPPTVADALDGVTRIDCAGPQEEAGVIALLLRSVAERPGKRAALVTPDRGLARRVAAELKRWGIDVDDSAGQPLDQTPPGAFLRLAAEMVAEEFAPVPLLATMKHRLAAGGRDPAGFRAAVRRFEMAVLRGPRPAAGVGGLKRMLSGEDAGRFGDLLDRLATLAGPLELLVATPR